MVAKNRCIKNNNYGIKDYEVKQDLMLLTQNKMLPILQSVTPEMYARNYCIRTVKPKIIQYSKRNNKSVLSFLQEPPCVFHDKDKKEPKVCQPTYSSSKSQVENQQSTIHYNSEASKLSIHSTLERFYKSRGLPQKTKEKCLPFPNTINFLNNKDSLHAKIINYNEKPSISILNLSNSARQKQEANDQLHAKIHSSNKQILLYTKRNTSYSSNAFAPITQNIYHEKQTNTNYINPIPSNLDHIQNKELTKTTTLTFLKIRTTNNNDSSIVPIDQSIFCDLIAPELYTKNSTEKKNGDIKDKIPPSCSEQMMKIVDYENKTLEMYHPKISELSSSIEDKDIKRSMSAIQYRKSTRCTGDIKNNISDPHIPQNKCNNKKSRSRFKVQYSSEDTDSRTVSENNTYITSKYEAKDSKKYIESGYGCRIKYSWQVIGTSVQTSKVLLYNFLEENKNQIYNYTSKPSIYKCDVKYSWQIIGTGTQVALQSSDNTDYWTGIIFKPNIHRDNKVITSNKKKEIDNDIRLYNVQQCGKKLLILNNQCTQTLAEKETQSDFTDCKVKYSWQNLIQQHL